MMIDIAERYHNGLTPLQKETQTSNAFALPKITKVTINVGLGQNRQNKDMVNYIAESVAKIAGQQPIFTHAHKAIAGFKLRQGDLVGVRVTLRGSRLTDFLNRLINITLPRIRDFRGIDERQFDQQGNLTLGFKDQVAFAE